MRHQAAVSQEVRVECIVPSHGQVKLVIIIENQADSFLEYFFTLEKNASLCVNVVYKVQAAQQLAFKTIQHHGHPHASSIVSIKGLVQGSANVYLDGLMTIEAGAPYTTAQYYNKNLLMRDAKARVVANPHLSVYNKQVVCKHGSATGMIDREHLHFLQMRGFTLEQSELILTRAFFEEFAQDVHL